VSGKLRAQRAKSMKFKDGYMISSGQPVNEYIDAAVRHVLLRQVCLLYMCSVGLNVCQAVVICLLQPLPIFSDRAG
jgi:small subunit ribosomal protein S3e